GRSAKPRPATPPSSRAARGDEPGGEAPRTPSGRGECSGRRATVARRWDRGEPGETGSPARRSFWPPVKAMLPGHGRTTGATASPGGSPARPRRESLPKTYHFFTNRWWEFRDPAREARADRGATGMGLARGSPTTGPSDAGSAGCTGARLAAVHLEGRQRVDRRRGLQNGRDAAEIRAPALLVHLEADTATAQAVEESDVAVGRILQRRLDRADELGGKGRRDRGADEFRGDDRRSGDVEVRPEVGRPGRVDVADRVGTPIPLA